ncbi:ADP-heptose synthase [Dissulfuribacter thermophilus]|uniref:D-glycero-beta-D-manno-heptose 1-phosphate adenylyltransferase n=1 Tax=Dissulfuribacter thermophilus TaxID=1156395 RepID=A0A1B9F871_9BACT|nr:D-glycero-beta-D-manno-heptose 1-phosphate adenylyltransferase [Dissulfuribacter thermophilus]OCC16100.1 ADP-heptose synthase [Dissulfuribacter thermophilus]
MESKTFKVALIQHDPEGKDPIEECNRVEEKIRNLSGKIPDLVVLPELWSTGPLKEHSLSLADCTSQILFRLETLATRYSFSILGGLAEKDELRSAETIYNSAFFITPGQKPRCYRKINLFPPFEEDKLFKSGEEPVAMWQNFDGVEVGIGPIICYDLRFPDLSREYSLLGCSIIVCMALWPKERIEHFSTLIRARAIENQCFVIGVNASGQLHGIEFGGSSLVVAPDGRVIAQAGTDPEEIVCEIDLTLVEGVRKKFFTARPPTWHQCSSSKVLDLPTLVKIVQRRKATGQKCVFTNGCFDILHAGHVAYLEEARRAGDFLVVGMNTDESIRSIKGPFRPVNPEAMRASVLAGLEAVDYVVLFDEPTPINVIKAIVPDCLIKGEDWREDEIVGANFVKAHGGVVKRIPFVHDVSTTKIIGKILRSQT